MALISFYRTGVRQAERRPGPGPPAGLLDAPSAHIIPNMLSVAGLRPLASRARRPVPVRRPDRTFDGAEVERTSWTIGGRFRR
jgi:hypothetical protein